jgi:hypothetical protein
LWNQTENKTLQNIYCGTFENLKRHKIFIGETKRKRNTPKYLLWNQRENKMPQNNYFEANWEQGTPLKKPSGKKIGKRH